MFFVIYVYIGWVIKGVVNGIVIRCIFMIRVLLWFCYGEFFVFWGWFWLCVFKLFKGNDFLDGMKECICECVVIWGFEVVIC